MFSKLRKMLRNEKGFTLVELLAVIVILGIIAAIAVPSIAGIIDNTREDAHDANAIQMIEASRLALASGLDLTEDVDGTDDGYTLSDLVTNGFIESIPNNPVDNATYSGTNSFVVIDTGATDGTAFQATLAPTSGTAYVTSANINELQQ